MTKRNDGGPAMPHNRSLALCEVCATEHACGGMSWVDYAAIQIMANDTSHQGNEGHTAVAARQAYDSAEALLKEKRKRDSARLAEVRGS